MIKWLRRLLRFRSYGTCGSCRYYVEGACKRFPPTRVYEPPVDGHNGIDVTVWPIVRPQMDWCGEHEA